MTSTPSGNEPTYVEPNSLAGLTLSIFSDLMATITQDICLEAHRSEKLNRMAMIQRNAPLAQELPSSPNLLVSAADSALSPNTQLAKHYGKALEIPFDEEICPKCLLPRHTVESFAATPIPGKKWCTKIPIHDIPGHDIYGNPCISSSVAPQTKKSRNAELVNDHNSPSTDTSTPPPASNGTNSKTSSQIPYVLCTNCPREIYVSRFAAHLEKCLGMNNRKSARAAAGRLNGSGIVTPSFGNASRRNSPVRPLSPASSGGNDDSSNGDGKDVKDGKSAKMEKKVYKKKGPKKKDQAAVEAPERASVTSAPRMEKSTSSLGRGSPSPSLIGAQSSIIKKKKKRKAEELEEKELSLLRDYDMEDAERSKALDANITPTKPAKKLKLTNSITLSKDKELAGSPGAVNGNVKNQLSKFMDKTGSTMVGVLSKKEKLSSTEVSRSQSDTTYNPPGSSSKPQSSSLGSPSPSSKIKGSPTLAKSKLTSTSLDKSGHPKVPKFNSKESAGLLKLSKDKKAERTLEREKEREVIKIKDNSKERDGISLFKKDKVLKSKSSSSNMVAVALAKGSKDSTSSNLTSPTNSPEKKKQQKNQIKLAKSLVPSGSVASKSLPKGSTIAGKSLPRSTSPTVVRKSTPSGHPNSNGKRDREGSSVAADIVPRKKPKATSHDHSD